MFVSKSKFNEMHMLALINKQKYENAAELYNALNKRWNDLVDRINKLGGENFLKRGEKAMNSTQFTAEDVQRLIQLCHPDKHDGKQMATEMTAKLIAFKNKLEKP